jgi:lipopolysaccharide/colanic/teichoic acid biosynthesis glycosyltransferase
MRRYANDRPVLPLAALLAKPLPWWKRGMDVLVSSAGLALLAPVILVIALVVKTTSKGPVFFTQERTGWNMRRFKMYKFRSMISDAEKNLRLVLPLNEMKGPLIKIEHDPRLTSVGGFLRKTSLDELPQLFNVLKGDMTLIGPRALSPKPSQYAAWQLRRFEVFPGIACYWQAQHRHKVDFNEWMRCDLKYIERYSFVRDISLIFKVIINVILCRGAR